MERQFTKSLGRFKAGQVCNFPFQTWEQIQRNAGRPLDSFTRDVVQPIEETKPKRSVAREDAMSA